MLHAPYSTGPQGISIHHERIELNPAIARQKAAPACIEGFVVFHGDDGRFHRVHGRAASLQQVPANGQSLAHSPEMGLDHVIWNGPGAAMNHQNRSVRHDSTSRGEWKYL